MSHRMGHDDMPDGWPPDEQEAPEEEGSVATMTQPPWCVIVYNDDWHTFDEVIVQLQLATGCDLQTATMHADTIHNEGRAQVHQGTRDECDKAAGILRRIRLQVEVVPVE